MCSCPSDHFPEQDDRGELELQEMPSLILIGPMQFFSSELPRCLRTVWMKHGARTP